MDRPFNTQVARLREQLCREFVETGELNPTVLAELHAYVRRRKVGNDAPALPSRTHHSRVAKPQAAHPVSQDDDPLRIAGQATVQRVANFICTAFLPPRPVLKLKKRYRKPGQPGYVKCAVANCNNVVRRRGYCGVHVEKFLTNGTLPRIKGGRKPGLGTCREPGCGCAVRCRGLCRKHYHARINSGALSCRRKDNDKVVAL